MLLLLPVEFYESLDQIPINNIIEPQAPILALLGDVGLAFSDHLRYFLHQQADRFEHVLYLAGNHEFYNHGRKTDSENGEGPYYYTVSEQLAWLRQVCQEKPNLYFMEQTTVHIGHVRILGTTLWSHVPDHTSHQAEQYLNDYHLSYVDDTMNGIRKIQTRDTNQWHRESVAWLEGEIDRAQQQQDSYQPVVVLTHHTPSMEGTSNPKYDGNQLSHCFSTNLTRLVLQPAVRVWACGHTHFNFHMQLRSDQNNKNNTTGTRLLSNQRGYPGGTQLDSFDPNGYIIDLASLVVPTPSSE